MNLDKSTYIFDLDNTLYSSKIRLFDQIDGKMGEFIANRFSLSLIDAKKMQKTYFKKYGTTLRGLMECHDIEPEEFLHFVHDIDFSAINKDDELSEFLSLLDKRKIIYTNADFPYALKVLERLGINGQFDGIFDIKDANYAPKPLVNNFDSFIERFEINTKDAVMFDDLARNLKLPSESGMITVLIQPNGGHNDEHVRIWEEDEDHSFIDYKYDDVKDFFRL